MDLFKCNGFVWFWMWFCQYAPNYAHSVDRSIANSAISEAFLLSTIVDPLCPNSAKYNSSTAIGRFCHFGGISAKDNCCPTLPKFCWVQVCQVQLPMADSAISEAFLLSTIVAPLCPHSAKYNSAKYNCQWQKTMAPLSALTRTKKVIQLCRRAGLLLDPPLATPWWKLPLTTADLQPFIFVSK